MRRELLLSIAILAGLAIVLASTITHVNEGAGDATTEGEAIFQAGTLEALKVAELQGIITVGEGLARGDIGLGTFEGLDGEMIVLDGICYQAKADGTVAVASAGLTSPFMEVADWLSQSEFEAARGMNFTSFLELLASHMTSSDAYCVFRVDGTFAAMQVRALPGQDEPYIPLQDAIPDESVFNYTDVEGVLVIIYAPEYVGTLTVPGFHLHFISADRSKGGHVIDMTVGQASVSMDEKNGFRLWGQLHQA
jgi:acetolactate decarboxylase